MAIETNLLRYQVINSLMILNNRQIITLLFSYLILDSLHLQPLNLFDLKPPKNLLETFFQFISILHK